MKTPSMFRISVIALVLSAAPACSQSEPPPQRAAGSAPAELRDGEQKFTANCSACHGAGGVGTKQGPPLVHKVYEPNHHGDVAFLRAAANGVKAHHWQFGDMPKIDAVKQEDVEQIVKYETQLAGLFYDTGRPQLAAEHCDAALKLCREQLNRQPASDPFRRLMARCLLVQSG